MFSVIMPQLRAVDHVRAHRGHGERRGRLQRPQVVPLIFMATYTLLAMPALRTDLFGLRRRGGGAATQAAGAGWLGRRRRWRHRHHLLRGLMVGQLVIAGLPLLGAPLSSPSVRPGEWAPRRRGGAGQPERGAVAHQSPRAVPSWHRGERAPRAELRGTRGQALACLQRRCSHSCRRPGRRTTSAAALDEQPPRRKRRPHHHRGACGGGSIRERR